MSIQHFDEGRFRQQVDNALSRIRTVLDVTRAPQYPADVPHAYDDKYGLAEFLTNTAIAAELNNLDLLGLTDKGLSTLKKWVETHSVTLRLKTEERCAFVREATREVESATKHVTEYSDNSNHNASVTRKVITKITEYFWKFTVDYELFAYQGNDMSDKVSFQARKGVFEIVTTTKSTPKVEVNISNIDTNITWLLRNINEHNQPTFTINRNDKQCHTPRRNKDIDTAFTFFRSFSEFSTKVQNYFFNQLFPVQTEHGLNLSAINATSVFVPVVALFEEQKNAQVAALAAAGASSSSSSSSFSPSSLLGTLRGKDKKEKKEKKEKGEKSEDKNKDKPASSSSSPVTPMDVVAPSATSTAIIPSTPAKPSPVLPIGDVNAFLAEQKRSFSEKFDELSKQFPDGPKLITVSEAHLVVVVQHAVILTQVYLDSVDYVELMLRRQLVAAIGKEVSAVDFANYMKFHNRKLFKAQYMPQPFSHAVRRPEHYPEGVVSIEAKLADGTVSEPITTIVRAVHPSTPMRFAINAATNVTFGGERFVHAYVAQQFAGYSGTDLNLVARARQFSSFLLLVGRIVSATEFEPKHAIIIQNKDEIIIPLLLEQLPTPKEFRDAIESLSPEQQAFCRAFRAMQLESSLFGICVIQLKPQLEKLLKLPDDSLTKEIKLTQELLELFIKYQIPSDLLTYDGPQEAAPATKIAAVKTYVANMYDMINASKEKELIEVHQEALFAAPLAYASYAMPTSTSASTAAYASVQHSVITTTTTSLPATPNKRREQSAGGFGARGGARSGAVSYSAPVQMSMAPMMQMQQQQQQQQLVPQLSQLSRRSSSSSAPAPAPAPSASISLPKPAPVVVSQSNSNRAPSASSGSVVVTPPTATSKPPTTTPTTPSLATDNGETDEVVGLDFTKIPTELDRKFGELDEDSALRPTIINPGKTWTKKHQKGLLVEPVTTTLGTTDLETERNKAFDLLDALSRSGSLTVDHASLHVVIAATHCFDKSLMDTVIQDNINPIVKVERSALIVATTIQGKSAQELVKADQQDRLESTLPKLFLMEE